MAVVVQCYHCNTILELDEGFRGGVCRCSTCGSLLQVPKASGGAAAKARPAAPGASPTTVTRPSSPTDDPGLSRGQFDAKNRSGGRPATPDIGGSSSGLRQSASGSPATATRPSKPEKVVPLSGPTQPVSHAKEIKKNNTMLLVAIGGGAFLLVIIAIIVVAIVFASGGENGTRGQGKTDPGAVDGNPTNSGSGGGAVVTPPPIKGPNFLGISLVGKQIILSVDSGSSMQDSFDFFRRAAAQATDSLNDDQKIMIAVWQDSTTVTVPGSGFVGKKDLRQIRDGLDSIPVRGSTNAEACMVSTLALGGDQIIFITAKYGLHESLTAPVVAAAKPGQRIDAVKITSEDKPSPLEAITQKAGGKYIFLTQTQLEQATNR